MSENIHYNKVFDLVPGRAEEVAPGVRAIVANNPGPFTFKGTVSYVVGRGKVAILDPGPDFAKTPAQTIELLAGIGRLHELGRPLLMAISRKDFIGALTGRPPRERLGGTLAALAHGVDAGARIFRVHDVAAVADFLRVRAALAGELQPRRDLALAEEHRYER